MNYSLHSYMTANFVLCVPKYRYWRGEVKLTSDLRRMFETGALAHLWSAYFPYEQMASLTSNSHLKPSEDEPIGLDTLYLLLALVTAILLVATAAFLCESLFCGLKKPLQRCSLRTK